MLTLTALTVKTEGENGTERGDYMGENERDSQSLKCKAIGLKQHIFRMFRKC